MSFEAYRWLLLWLQPSIDYVPFTLYEHTYVIEKKFRIAFNVYTIIRDTTTNEYIWYIIENNKFHFEKFMNSKRYTNYNDLLMEVSQDFYHKWNQMPK
jgi:hypothetical protein